MTLIKKGEKILDLLEIIWYFYEVLVEFELIVIQMMFI